MRARIDVRREERLALAQTERDIADIRAGRKHVTSDHRLLEGPAPNHETASRGELAPGTLAGAAQRRVILEHMRAEVNVAKALLCAETELEEDTQEPPDRTVDEDWLFRWRDSASKVSSQELQVLWGRVLAGEIKSPGAFSLRALEFLKNLSQDEAQRIEQLAPFVIDSGFVCAEYPTLSIFEPEGVTLDLLLQLEELGIVSAVTAHLTQALTSSVAHEFRVDLIAYDRVLVVTHEDPKKSLVLRVYKLTSLGRQVLRLGAFKAHDAYIRSVGNVIKRKRFKVLLARHVQVTETESRWFEAEEL